MGRRKIDPNLKTGEKVRRVIAAMRSEGGFTTSEICDAVGMPNASNAAYWLKKMAKAGEVKYVRSGVRGNGRWYVVARARAK